MIQGFRDDMDGFVEFSFSIQNRRKSRAGYALANHLEAIFREHNIRCSREKVTENRPKPDFVFPFIEVYPDETALEEQLTVLGVKQTCKDRWRQVLSEARRIAKKHLLTLEPGISTNQTDEMQANGLLLVVPSEIQDTYQPDEKQWLMSLSEFLEKLAARRAAI